MPIRSFLVLCAAAFSLSGCLATPRIEIAQRLDFDYITPAQAPVMSYNDLLCCLECKA